MSYRHRMIRNRRVQIVANPYKLHLINNNKNKLVKRRPRNYTIKDKKKNTPHKSIYDSSSSSRLGDDTVVCEILSRLPAKSLMRFKCVCKHWQDLIQQDSYFIDLHLTRSKTRPGLLIVIPLQAPLRAGLICGLQQRYRKRRRCERVPRQELHLSAELLGGPHQLGKALINNIMKTNSLSEYDGYLASINGLVCIVDTKLNYRVRIYNPSTREITPWIESTLLTNEQEEGDHFDVVKDDMSPTYIFGFDPATKEHKVLCVWAIGCGTEVYEVLTVGQTMWRRVNGEEPPFNFFAKDSLYANGCIYWNDRGNRFLTVFNVGSEKFGTIAIPDFIRDHLPWDTYKYYETLQLLEVDGSPSLLVRTSNFTVKMWIHDGGNKGSTSITTSCSSSSNWTEMVVRLPLCWEVRRRFYFHTVPGTDQIIFETYGYGDHRQIKHATLYSYNWKKDTFSKIELSGIPDSIPRYEASLFTTFVESLLPIQKPRRRHRRH